MIALEAVQGRWGSFSLSVTLGVERGEYLVILGPSGCGKSLLLGSVAGIEPLAAGKVLLDGRDVTGAPPEQRNVGFVFQRFALFPHLSVAGNIAFGLEVRGVPKAERARRVEELRTVLDLDRLMDRPVATLSGGESQKVAIARALAPRPAILLLDEPLSLVDHNARLELQQELARVHRTLGFTALHVTHNREEARALGGRCAVMLGGRILQTGTAARVFDTPSCVFVQRFLGAQPSEAPLPAHGRCSEICLAGAGRCDLASDPPPSVPSDASNAHRAQPPSPAMMDDR